MKRFVTLFCAFFLVLLVSARALAVDQTVAVTGTILPKPSDFDIALVPITTNDPVSQDTAIEYQITYGSHLFYNAPLTLTASWQPGTLVSDTPSQIDIVDYDANSAGTASGTQPVIDLVNQKIVWNIPAFPAQTSGASVRFRLKTNHNYTGANQVEFITKATLASGAVTTPEVSATKHYIYTYIAPTAGPSPVPTGVPGPSATPGPGAASGSIPSTGSEDSDTSKLDFTDISLETLSFDNLSLQIGTTTETALKVLYGSSPTNLSLTAPVGGFAKDHKVFLDKLAENTSYYVKVIATSRDGQTITSNIYQFKTAIQSEIPEVRKHSLYVTSMNSILIDPSLLGSGSATLVVPKKQSFEVKFALDKNTDIKRVTISIKNKDVLGINSFLLGQFTEDSASNDVVELSTGEFIGRLKTPLTAGDYEIVVRVQTKSGSITEHKLADMKLTENFRVTNEKTGKGIEGAQVIMYYLNPRSHQYDLLPSQIFPIKNPEYTDINGEISLALPQGQFMAKINAVGYGQVEQPFTIGMGDGVYPHIVLHDDPFSLRTVVSYYWTTLADVAKSSKLYVEGLSNSIRFFELNALIVTTIMVTLTLLTFSSRLHVPLHSLSDYLWHHSQIANVRKKLGQRIKGRVFDENSAEALPGADIYLINIDTHKVVGHTITDSNGDFSLVKVKDVSYDIVVLKEGYEELNFRESEIDAVELGGYLLTIKKSQIGLSVLAKIKIYFNKVVGLFFEVMIVLTVLFEVSLGYALGWILVLPFMIFSFINLALWILHLSHLRSEKNIF